MADDLDTGMTLHEEVEADLSEELSQRLHGLIKARTDLALFHDRLVHILTRFESYHLRKPQVTRKERGKQLTNVKDKAEKLLAALNVLHPEVLESLDFTISGSLQHRVWEEFDFFDESAPTIADDGHISNCVTAVSDVMAAAEEHLRQLENTKGTKRTSDNPALDQLISDLADLYETEAGLDQAANYRSPTAEDGYKGGLFLLTISLLNAYAPRSYSSAEALGKRIERILKTL